MAEAHVISFLPNKPRHSRDNQTYGGFTTRSSKAVGAIAAGGAAAAFLVVVAALVASKRLRTRQEERVQGATRPAAAEETFEEDVFDNPCFQMVPEAAVNTAVGNLSTDAAAGGSSGYLEVEATEEDATFGGYVEEEAPKVNAVCMSETSGYMEVSGASNDQLTPAELKMLQALAGGYTGLEDGPQPEGLSLFGSYGDTAAEGRNGSISGDDEWGDSTGEANTDYGEDSDSDEEFEDDFEDEIEDDPAGVAFPNGGGADLERFDGFDGLLEEAEA